MKASILYEMITKKRNPWTQTLVTYRFVNASLHVYITITIKEQNEVVVVRNASAALGSWPWRYSRDRATRAKVEGH